MHDAIVLFLLLVCKNTIRATCDRYAFGDSEFNECIECFEYFDDETQCIQANERRCIWDDDRRVCIFDLEIDT